MVDSHAVISNRTFGLVLGGVAALLAAAPVFFSRPAQAPLFAVSVLLIGAAAVLPRALYLPKVVWLGITMRIGQVVTLVLLAASFYAVLTPFSLFFRLIGRDLLKRKPDKAAKSYWQPRKKSKILLGMQNQF